MKDNMLHKAAEYEKAHQRKKRWYRIVTSLAAVVVFCTVYALILPAITMEGKNVYSSSDASSSNANSGSVHSSSNTQTPPNALLPLTEEEQAQVDEVIAMIDALPTSEETEEALNQMEQAESADGQSEYLWDIPIRASKARLAYNELNEKQKAHVTNSEKLMGLLKPVTEEELESIHQVDHKVEGLPTPEEVYEKITELEQAQDDKGKEEYISRILASIDETCQAYETLGFYQKIWIENSHKLQEQKQLRIELQLKLAVYEKTFENSNYKVTVYYNEAAKIPENAELLVEEIASDSERYAKREAEAQEALDNKSASLDFLLDIGFYAKGQEIEPEDTVTVVIQFKNAEGYAEGDPIRLIHFTEEKAELVENSEIKDSATIFRTDSFSEFGGISPASTDALGLDGKTFAIIALKTADTDNALDLAITDTVTGDGRLQGIKIPEDRDNRQWILGTEALITKWKFSLVPEGNSGEYYIRNGKGLYLEIEAGTAGVTDTPTPITVTRRGIESRDGHYMLARNGYALNRYNGPTQRTFGGYDSLQKDDNGNYVELYEYDKVVQYIENLGIKRDEINTVSGTDLNATVKVFDYTSQINNEGLGPKGFKFFNSEPGGTQTVDGSGQSGGNYNFPVMETKLGDDGYPNTDRGSMNYLFNDTHLQGTMADGGGLFQQDSEGYYYYDSARNAAYYDSNKKQFTLYNCTIRPDYTTYCNYNFLPFNEITEDTISYDDEEKTNPEGNVTKYRRKIVDQNGRSNYSLRGTGDGRVDLWFGMSVQFDFYMPKDGKINGKDMIFDFSGDDDVFVYIDDNLVLDINGTHGPHNGNINFANGKVKYQHMRLSDTGEEVTEDITKTLAECFNANDATETIDGDTLADYTKHTLRFFYMERGGNISYCRLQFNMPTLPYKSLTVGKTLKANDNSDLMNYIAENLTYRFRVVKADANGNATDQLFIPAGTQYLINETQESGTVGEGGYFELKAGQNATFKNLLSLQNGTRYIVQEFLPEELSGQYSDVEYTVNGTGGAVRAEEGQEEEFATFQTPELSAEESQVVNFTNKIDVSKLCKLRIKKQVMAGSTIEAGTVFNIQVKLEGNPIPTGTAYAVNGVNKIVEEEGIIQLKAGETAEIGKPIVSGTKYEVTEMGVTENKYRVTYTGTVTDSEHAGGTDIRFTNAAQAADGTFPLASTVEITVKNANYDFAAEIPITKKCVGNSGNASFSFEITQVDEKGNSLPEAPQLPGTTIEVTGDTPSDGKITLGYSNDTGAGTYYYKVTERNRNDDQFVYDDSVYIVAVQVEKQADGKSAQIDKIWKKDGQALNPSQKLSFVNTKTVPVTVKKFVKSNDGTTPGGTFWFEITVTPRSGAETSERFELPHGGTKLFHVPYRARVVVKEITHDGYAVTYLVDSGKSISGDTVTIPDIESGTTIEFTNITGYELPATGGPGTIPYTTGGLLFTAAAGVLLMYNNKKRRKEETASF